MTAGDRPLRFLDYPPMVGGQRRDLSGFACVGREQQQRLRQPEFGQPVAQFAEDFRTGDPGVVEPVGFAGDGVKLHAGGGERAGKQRCHQYAERPEAKARRCRDPVPSPDFIRFSRGSIFLVPDSSRPGDLHGYFDCPSRPLAKSHGKRVPFLSLSVNLTETEQSMNQIGNFCLKQALYDGLTLTIRRAGWTLIPARMPSAIQTMASAASRIASKTINPPTMT
ncbi:hypothetical protein [Candidatus Burkholderia verschuerenii]|uniref:hypothetical protein n=1 Tax=Candidatus Burkholderia verschuerenii TaxID=242163 RepID=UPI0012ECFD2E|nr:hypothetical protein [Candidatus Burkholderia verschuerenii]